MKDNAAQKFLRRLRPYALQEKLYFHSALSRPPSANGALSVARLAFAPVELGALDMRDCAHRQIARLGFYELALTRAIVRLGHRGGLLVDVGANIGYFTCLWAALGPENRALAFEPSPRNLPGLKANVARAGFQSRISIHDCALGRVSGRVAFDLGPDDQSGWGGLAPAPSPGAIHVQVKLLDDVLPPGTRVSVLKIDAEGADTWVLQGAARLLRDKRVAHVFFEQNAARMRLLGIPAQAAHNFLAKLGYRVGALPGDKSDTEFCAVPAG